MPYAFYRTNYPADVIILLANHFCYLTVLFESFTGNALKLLYIYMGEEGERKGEREREGEKENKLLEVLLKYTNNCILLNPYILACKLAQESKVVTSWFIGQNALWLTALSPADIIVEINSGS